MKRVYSVIKSLSPAKNLVANSITHSTVSKNRNSTALSFLICALLLGCAISSRAQTVDSKEVAKSTAAIMPAQAGTYQLIFNSRRDDIDIKLSPQELMVVEKLRKDNEVVYARASYSDDIRVKILPRNVITRPGFTSLPLKYYKEENNYDEWSQIRYVEFE